MTQFLPPNLLAFFAPRDPIPYLPPLTKLNHEKKTHGYFGVGQYLDLFEDPKDTPPPTKIETREERLERKQREKLERAAYIREQGIALWDPYNNSNATNDPYKTLFVARINPDTSESRLRKEFEVYGPVRKVMLIHDKISGKPKGYAFIEFENEKDMHSAYKHADGKKIEGRRVLVDVERGRTVKGWLPRRLGGGLGDTRSTRSSFRDDREDKYEKSSYRDHFDRRDRDRDRSSRRSRSREKDRSSSRRGRSREKERERSRDHREHRNDRHKDRYDSKLHRRDESKYEQSSRGGGTGSYDSYSEQKLSSQHSSYDVDSYISSSRRHRSRSRDRAERKRDRHGRSRSRSPRERNERKRSRFNESNNGTIEKQLSDRHSMASNNNSNNYDGEERDSGEIEEGEDQSYDGGYGGSKNGVDNVYDDFYQNSYSQQAYVAYKSSPE